MNKKQKTQRWGSNTRKDSQETGRDIILNAAIDCYQHKGITGTTIDDIAAEAKISRRTVYRYFANKQEIIQAIVDEQAEVFFKEMEQALQLFSGDFIASLKTCMLYTIENGPKAPGHELLLGKTNASASSHHYFNSTNISAYWTDLLYPSFKEAQSKGEISPDIDFAELMKWSARLIYSFIQLPEDPGVIERQIERFLLRSLT